MPALPDPTYDTPTPAPELAGRYGPLALTADTSYEALLLDGRALGAPDPVTCRRLGGDTFITADHGGMPFSFDAGLLYLGPFAIPRTD